VIVKGVLRHLAKAFAHPLQFREGGDKADQKNGGQYPGERRMALNLPLRAWLQQYSAT
jgi:hypothetical protein